MIIAVPKNGTRTPRGYELDRIELGTEAANMMTEENDPFPPGRMSHVKRMARKAHHIRIGRISDGARGHARRKKASA